MRHVFFKKSIVVGAILLFIGAGITSQALGNTVHNFRTQESFSTIQAAINVSENGDFLFVGAGIYQENVTINKSLTILGDPFNDQTIDGGSSGVVVKITAERVTIKWLTIKSNGNYTGIRIESNSNIIYGNNIQDCTEGIYLYSNTKGNVVAGNTITGSRMIGISLYSSTGNWLYNNTVIGSPEYGEMGILINYSNTNKIYANIIQDNNNGIYLNVSSYNIIHHNNFVGNYANARILGNCIENQWDNDASSGGNYWSDHPCTDSNDDGICDAPYYIPYGGGANDRYPLASQWSPVCGNVNGDPKNQISLVDPSYLSSYLYLGGNEPVPMCAADVNGDGEVNPADLSYLIDYLYGSGENPPVQNCCSKLVLPLAFFFTPL